MKIHGYFLDERLTEQEKQNLYDECRGCLNRICVTDDKTEVLTLLASLQTKAMILGKNTFLRIDEESNHWIEIQWQKWGVKDMGKLVDMSKYDVLFDNLEEYVNRQGCTLGEDADRLQKLMYSIQYCYLHGVLTDNQVRQANEKFTKQFQKALYEM